jgi:hypothetical protein
VHPGEHAGAAPEAIEYRSAVADKPVVDPAGERAHVETIFVPYAGSAPNGKERPAGERRTPRNNIWNRVWRSRALWLGLIALGCALNGQRLVVEEQAIAPAIRWYTAGVILVILAWLGTYRNKTCLPSQEMPVSDDRRQTTGDKRRALVVGADISLVDPANIEASSVVRRPSSVVFRYLLAFAALGLNLYSAAQLRSDYYSVVGSVGWVASLLLLLLAFVGHRARVGGPVDRGVEDVEDRTDWRISRSLEIAIALAIIALGVGLRLYRLGDWTTGVHPDEGYAGTDAMNIVKGDLVSPFLTGWYSQPNFYYWGIALLMKVFGTDLFGLRMFSFLAGSLMLPPFYGLVRMWFGVRMAIVATFLLAVSDLALIVSKLEFSNSTTPLFLVLGLFLLFRGLRSGRTLEFVLAGYAFMLNLYFYNGGQIAPLLLVLVLAYLFLLMPVVRLPGVYAEVRERLSGISRLQALGQAARIQARGVYRYAGSILALAIASICLASPFGVYFIDHAEQMRHRAEGVLIFNLPDQMAAQYQVTHEPLYLGLRMPSSDDIYPVLPLVFENTPARIKLLDDGFWPRVVWGQLTTTLSLLTFRHDSSPFYAVNGQPVAKPIEAALIVLALAWALWRWRDTRMSVLSMWFWSSIIVGGVFTVQAPYMPRLVGIVPTLAILAAIPLNKLAAELIERMRNAEFGMRNDGRVETTFRIPHSELRIRLAHGLVALVLVGLLGYLGWQNYNDYFVLHRPLWADTESAGQAFFVKQMNEKVVAEGRPEPLYYDVGLSWFGDGANRFTNHGTKGLDMVNPAHDLPVLNNGDRDVVFMIAESHLAFLPMVKQFYPGGQEEAFSYNLRGKEIDNMVITSYRVKREKIDALRMSHVSYTSATGATVDREEPALGSTVSPPDGLTYPVGVTWRGGLVAPAFARYRFRVSGAGGGNLVIDGLTVATSAPGAAGAEGEVVLARGPHEVTLSGALPTASARLHLGWSAGDSMLYYEIARKYLWDGTGRGLAGEVRRDNTDPFAAAPPDLPGGTNPVIQRRVDGFLSYRVLTDIIGGGSPFMSTWTGSLAVAQTGVYSFVLSSYGGSLLLIDDNIVADNRRPDESGAFAESKVELAEGEHRIEVRYHWNGGPAYLEVFWTPPGGSRGLLGPDVLHTDAGAWPPGSITEPPPYQLEVGEKP